MAISGFIKKSDLGLSTRDKFVCCTAELRGCGNLIKGASAMSGIFCSVSPSRPADKK